MAKRAPVWNTGGGGFGFEDQVATKFLIDLLDRSFPLDPKFGSIEQIDWQTQDTGATLDDLLLTLRRGNHSTTCKAEISIKSSQYVTATGFPSEFADAVHSRWSSGQFDGDSNLLVLALGYIGQGFRQDWDRLLSEAAAASPERFVERVFGGATDTDGQLGGEGPDEVGSQFSKNARTIFDSLLKPIEKLGKASADTSDSLPTVERRLQVARILPSLRVLDFDYRSNPSDHKSKAIKTCQRLLSTHDTAVAEQLYRRLLGIASDCRTKGGFQSFQTLIAEIGVEFPALRPGTSTIATVHQASVGGEQISRSVAEAERISKEVRTAASTFETEREVELLKKLHALFDRSGDDFPDELWNECCLHFAREELNRGDVDEESDGTDRAGATRCWLDQLRDDVSGNQATRRLVLEAFLVELNESVDAAIARIGLADDPVLFEAKLKLLLRAERYDDVIRLTEARSQERTQDLRWGAAAVQAYVHQHRFDDARQLVTRVEQSAIDNIRRDTARFIAAQAACTDLEENCPSLIPLKIGQLTNEEIQQVKFAVEMLEPLLETVRRTNKASTAIERASLQNAVMSYCLLGQMTEVQSLSIALERVQPVPLLLARLAIERCIDVPDNLATRLWDEHPGDLFALTLSCVVESELDGRDAEAFRRQLAAESLAKKDREEVRESFCYALLERASRCGEQEIAEAEAAISRLEICEETREQLLQIAEALNLIDSDQTPMAIERLQANPRPDDFVWIQLMRNAAANAGDQQAAAKYASQLADLVPHPDLKFESAMYRAKQPEMLDESIEDLRAAVAARPDDLDRRRHLCNLLLRAERYREAAAELGELADRDANNAQSRFNQGVALIRAGQLDEAAAAFAQVDDRSPYAFDAVIARSGTLARTDHAEDAISLLQSAQLEDLDDDRQVDLLMHLHNHARQAGQEDLAEKTFGDLLKRRETSEYAASRIKAFTLDEMKDWFRGRRESLRQRAAAIVSGEAMWLASDLQRGLSSLGAWEQRTQPLDWLPEDTTTRGQYSIYATFGVWFDRPTMPTSSEDVEPAVGNEAAPASLMHPPLAGRAAVVDFTALISLYKLELLDAAAAFCRTLIVPESLLQMKSIDLGRLQPNQPAVVQQARNLLDAIESDWIQIDETVDFFDGCGDTGASEEVSHSAEIELSSTCALLVSRQVIDLQEASRLISDLDPSVSSSSSIASPVRVSLATAKRIASADWFEAAAKSNLIALSEQDRTELQKIVRAEEKTTQLRKDTEDLWRLLDALEKKGHIEYRTSPSCRAIRDADGNQSDSGLDSGDTQGVADIDQRNIDQDAEINDGVHTDDNQRFDYLAAHFDPPLLASDLGLPLLSDDRLLQTYALGVSSVEYPAAGTNHLVTALEEASHITSDESDAAMLRLMEWRYRWVIPSTEQLKRFADRGRGQMPGPSLLKVATSMRDSLMDWGVGRIGGGRKVLGVAMGLFFAWRTKATELVCEIWADAQWSDEDAAEITSWIASHLVPPLPRSIERTAQGSHVIRMTEEAILKHAVLSFMMLPDVRRAHRAVRVLADAFGIADSEVLQILGEHAESVVELVQSSDAALDDDTALEDNERTENVGGATS